MAYYKRFPCSPASSMRAWMQSVGVGLKIVLIGLSLTLLLSSCAGLSGQSPKQPVPIPVLESATINNQGGICIDREDTAELLHYLDLIGDN